MFKHILIPTDGSDASARAVTAGLRIAGEQGARVSVIHVMPEMPIYAYQGEILADTFEQFNNATASYAKTCLDQVSREAEAAGVRCEQICVRGAEPYRAILDAAQSGDCDLIVMGSHGKKGIQRLVLGSETQKVLIHGTVPVLVFR
jgi:nucleotide-binding universal stress UspA family protein